MSIPYIPLYVTDYEADTAHLSLEEDGAYMRLLRLCWRTPGCSVPDEPRWIMRKMRISADDYYRVVEPLIDEFFTRGMGRVFSARLQREEERIKATSKKRSEAGLKGGRPANPLKNNETTKSRAKAKQKHLKPELELDKEDTIVSSSAKRKTRIQEGAFISEKMLRAAEKRGHSQQEAEAQFGRFKNDALAKGKLFLDWDRAFLTWLDSPYFKTITTGGMNGQSNVQESGADFARRAGERYAEREARRMAGGENQGSSQPLLPAGQPARRSGSGN